MSDGFVPLLMIPQVGIVLLIAYIAQFPPIAVLYILLLQFVVIAAPHLLATGGSA